MTRSIRGSRRAALLLSGITAASLLASGCGTGQIAETALKEPSVQGVNLTTNNGSFSVRGLLVDYPSPEGYKAGQDAGLGAVIYNDSKETVTVTVTTESAREVVISGGSASPSPSASESASMSPSPSGSASPSNSTSGSPSPSATPSETGSSSATPSAPESARASGSASPSAPGQPARIELAPLSYIQFNSESTTQLRLIGLTEALRSGQNVVVTFDFGNGNTVTGQAPVAVPLTPAAPPSPIIEREGGYEGNEGGTTHE
ncbi:MULTISPECIES: hypothetical protein [Micromonospora]|uniref:hypothetical protein n=1 Tax=Micromonospora TaxID=1873 RepID=UPI001EE7A562|nr:MULTISPECIES: hypothetical protein [Micromonospora]MCG5452751.1 hypothetical protein [Micromonospora hortensis]MCX5120035.1 hypothetical protein [Micromonospora sp. NBC_00362]WTI07976.1 hypothetical protein OHB44_32230 [Micromonospora sp. NBC_00821]